MNLIENFVCGQFVKMSVPFMIRNLSLQNAVVKKLDCFCKELIKMGKQFFETDSQFILNGHLFHMKTFCH